VPGAGSPLSCTARPYPQLWPVRRPAPCPPISSIGPLALSAWYTRRSFPKALHARACARYSLSEAIERLNLLAGRWTRRRPGPYAAGRAFPCGSLLAIDGEGSVAAKFRGTHTRTAPPTSRPVAPLRATGRVPPPAGRRPRDHSRCYFPSAPLMVMAHTRRPIVACGYSRSVRSAGPRDIIRRPDG
jgi:hypothetical protein